MRTAAERRHAYYEARAKYYKGHISRHKFMQEKRRGQREVCTLEKETLERVGDSTDLTEGIGSIRI